MDGAINCSFISAHFLLSTYFLTAQTYKRMRFITRVYGSYIDKLEVHCIGPGNEANHNLICMASSFFYSWE